MSSLRMKDVKLANESDAVRTAAQIGDQDPAEQAQALIHGGMPPQRVSDFFVSPARRRMINRAHNAAIKGQIDIVIEQVRGLQEQTRQIVDASVQRTRIAVDAGLHEAEQAAAVRRVRAQGQAYLKIFVVFEHRFTFLQEKADSGVLPTQLIEALAQATFAEMQTKLTAVDSRGEPQG